MSSQDYPSLAIEPNRRLQRIVVVAVATISLAVPFFIPAFSRWAAVGLSSMTVLLALANFRRIGWLGGTRGVVCARRLTDGTWDLQGEQGDALHAVLAPGSQILADWIRLRFVCKSGSREVLVWGRSLPEDVRRRLVVCLRSRLQAVRGAHPADTGSIGDASMEVSEDALVDAATDFDADRASPSKLP